MSPNLESPDENDTVGNPMTIIELHHTYQRNI